MEETACPLKEDWQERVAQRLRTHNHCDCDEEAKKMSSEHHHRRLKEMSDHSGEAMRVQRCRTVVRMNRLKPYVRKKLNSDDTRDDRAPFVREKGEQNEEGSRDA